MKWVKNVEEWFGRQLRIHIKRCDPIEAFIQCLWLSCQWSEKINKSKNGKMVPKKVLGAMVISQHSKTQFGSKTRLTCYLYLILDSFRHHGGIAGFDRSGCFHRFGAQGRIGWPNRCGKSLRLLRLLSSESTAPPPSSPSLRRIQEETIILLRQLIRWLLQRLLQWQVPFNANPHRTHFQFSWFQVTISVPEIPTMPSSIICHTIICLYLEINKNVKFH